MVERRQAEHVEEKEIDLGEYFSILRSYWLKIFGISLAVGFFTLLLLFLKSNVYKASATITPSKEYDKQNPGIEALSSYGINIGGPTEAVDLEALFRSNDLTVRVFRNHDLWPIVAPDRYDPNTKKLKIGWVDRWLGRKKDSEVAEEWDAIRFAEDYLTVSVNKKMGTLSISIESPSAEGSAEIAMHYLEEAKSRLQEEAFDRAVKNKKFIQEQIGKTVDALTRDRFFSLYGREVEREMMARNREQFGFRIIDRPRVPDRNSGPRRALAAILTTLLSFCVLSIVYGIKGIKNLKA